MKAICVFSLALTAAAFVLDKPAAAQYVSGSTPTTINGASNGVVVGWPNANAEAFGIGGTSSTVNIVSPADIQGNVEIWNDSTANVTGGTITGGIGNVATSSVGNTALNQDTSFIDITGGTIEGGAGISGNGTLDISSGNVFSATGTNTSSIDISGGQFASDLELKNGATATVSGGTFGPYSGFYDYEFIDLSTGDLTFQGTGLNATFENAATIEFTPPGIAGSVYELGGTLSDGSSINGDLLFVEDNGNFSLDNTAVAPEMTTSVSLAIGLVCLFAFTVLVRRSSRSVS